MEQTVAVEDNFVFGDDDLHKSLQQLQDADAEKEEKKVVLTEMEEFVCGLQLHEEAHKSDAEDVLMAPSSSDEGQKGKYGDLEEVKADELMADEVDDVKPDETIHKSLLGKELSGKDTVESSGRNMDEKKSKLVNYNDDKKEIRVERTDEYGRILTPKKPFRLFLHKLHGKERKQEKLRRRSHELMMTPYLVLSGHDQPGYVLGDMGPTKKAKT